MSSKERKGLLWTEPFQLLSGKLAYGIWETQNLWGTANKGQSQGGAGQRPDWKGMSSPPGYWSTGKRPESRGILHNVTLFHWVQPLKKQIKKKIAIQIWNTKHFADTNSLIMIYHHTKNYQSTSYLAEKTKYINHILSQPWNKVYTLLLKIRRQHTNWLSMSDII